MQDYLCIEDICSSPISEDESSTLGVDLKELSVPPVPKQDIVSY